MIMVFKEAFSKARFVMAADFNASLDDFKAYATSTCQPSTPPPNA